MAIDHEKTLRSDRLTTGEAVPTTMGLGDSQPSKQPRYANSSQSLSFFQFDWFTCRQNAATIKWLRFQRTMQSQPLSTIVVPIDYTETSLKALAVAVRLCQQQQADMHLVYIIEPVVSAAVDTTGPGPLQDAAVGQSPVEEAAMIQTLAMQMVQQHQVRCSSTYRTGMFVEEVVAIAREAGADLIVVGIRLGNDRAALKQVMNVWQLVERGPCSVLTIPNGGREWPSFERVLFPVRPVPGALAKYEFARQLLTKQKAELLILALYKPNEIISRHELEEDVQVLTMKLTQDGVKSSTQFCPTDLIAETVLEKAAEFEADLLIITANLITASANFFTGPFARQILYNASLPVLAIRPEH